ncbi:hypothetical protein ABH977_001142 [Bradyrhizobium ottawaense]
MAQKSPIACYSWPQQLSHEIGTCDVRTPPNYGLRDQPAAEGLGDAVCNPALRRDQAGAFPAGLRTGLRRPLGRDRGDHQRSGRARLRQHHHRAGALGQAAEQGGGRILRPRFGAFQPGHPGDRQGGLSADGAALESDHDERCAVRPHRPAPREPRQSGSGSGAASPLGADLHPLPPRRRRPLRGGQDADGRDQRAARPTRHQLQPSSARRRAGLGHGARGSRPPGPAGELRRQRQGCGRRARHGRQGHRHAVAILGRTVPEKLRPA